MEEVRGYLELRTTFTDGEAVQHHFQNAGVRIADGLVLVGLQAELADALNVLQLTQHMVKMRLHAGDLKGLAVELVVQFQQAGLPVRLGLIGLQQAVVLDCDCNDSAGKDYSPKATYNDMTSSDDKQNDAFLATDCIGTEKLVSGEYNSDVFAFGKSNIRKLLADIQIEEQNHAEMLYKYKTANGMA